MSGLFGKAQSSEIAQLRIELGSSKMERQKDAVKQVIASMTYGKDVSSLFPDIVKCMYTTSLELKKLVYLYIINYAKSKPDLTILAIQTFRTDATNKTNPLLRALAVRTMGCIRVEKIAEYLCESLKDALQDPDPYVRKTAAVCVAKLFSTNPRLVKDHGFISVLQGMLADGNSVVVANAIAALLEISALTGKNYIRFRDGNVSRLLNAVNESLEWGQVYLLQAIARYRPHSSKEAEDIIERVYPRLTHVNPAVVLAAVKVVLKFMDFSRDTDFVRTATSRLANPLISLLTAPHQIQYIALRNIKFILDRRPTIFDSNIKIFFIKYTDPVYVKLEKIEVLKRVANVSNIDLILSELKEYARDFDVDCMRRAIRSIGHIIFQVDRAAKKAIQLIKDVINSPSDAALQESVAVVMNILRKYPNDYQELLGDIVRRRAAIFEPQSRCCFTWLVGEFGHFISEAMIPPEEGNQDQELSGISLLEQLVEGFHDQDEPTKKQILSAVIKYYLKDPQEEGARELVEKVFELASHKDQDPDLRDRAYIYWRLLKADPARAEEVVLTEKPPVIADNILHMSEAGQDLMIDRIGHLSSIVYNIEVEEYAEKQEVRKKLEEECGDEVDEEIEMDTVEAERTSPLRNENLYEKKGKHGSSRKVRGKKDQEGEEEKKESKVPRRPKRGAKGAAAPAAPEKTPEPSPPKPSSGGGDMIDLLDMDYGAEKPVEAAAPAPTSGGGGGGAFDLLSMLGGVAPAKQGFTAPAAEQVLPSFTPGSQFGNTGLQISAYFHRADNQIKLNFMLGNSTQATINDFQIQMNVNSFGITAASQSIGVPSLAPIQQSSVDIPCIISPDHFNKQLPTSPFFMQCAIKNSLDVFYFQVPLYIHTLFQSGISFTAQEFKALAAGTGAEFTMTGGKFSTGDVVAEATQKLQGNGFVAVGPGQLATKMDIDNLPVLVMMQAGGDGVTLSGKVSMPAIVELLKQSLTLILGVH